MFFCLLTREYPIFCATPDIVLEVYPILEAEYQLIEHLEAFRSEALAEPADGGGQESHCDS